MPNHQDRRAPLPAHYQFPTHGVDCDCPPCRNSIATQMDRRVAAMIYEASTLPTIPTERVQEAVRSIEEPTAETPWGV